MTTKKNSPCLLSDNGPCYIASSLKQYLCKEYNIRHIFRAMGENQENTRPNKENSINKRISENKRMILQHK